MKKVSVIAVLLLIGILSWQCNLEDPTSVDVTEHEIVIRDNGFFPATITVGVGERIFWRNAGNLTHSVSPGTFMNPTTDFDPSENISPGSTSEDPVIFTQPGTVAYYCDIHQQNLKEGTIIVQ